MRRFTLALVLCATVALVVSAAASARPAAWEKGSFTANRGGLGVKLGHTRAQVVARLGQPVYENQNGYMQYAETNLFDVYLGANNRVRMIGISGPKFCTKTLCLFRKGGVAKLVARYGSKLEQKSDFTGIDCYLLEGSYGGKKVFTSFYVDSFAPNGRVYQVFIVRGVPDPDFC